MADRTPTTQDMWETVFSEEVGTEWQHYDMFGVCGIVNAGSSENRARYFLGMEKPRGKEVGDIFMQNKEHEFCDQRIWFRSGQGRTLISIMVNNPTKLSI